MTTAAIGTWPAPNGAAVQRTDRPCPVCVTLGHRTLGGDIPTMAVYGDDLFCLVHGKQAVVKPHDHRWMGYTNGGHYCGECGTDDDEARLLYNR